LPDREINQTNIAEKVFDTVEVLTKELPGLGCEYEYLPTNAKELPCLMMSTLPGNPIEKEYLDGAYIANYRFSLLLRQAAEETQARIDALQSLRNLANLLEKDPPELGDGCQVWSCQVDNLPARISAEEPYVDYQVTLRVQYRAHR